MKGKRRMRVPMKTPIIIHQVKNTTLSLLRTIPTLTYITMVLTSLVRYTGIFENDFIESFLLELIICFTIEKKVKGLRIKQNKKQ